MPPGSQVRVRVAVGVVHDQFAEPERPACRRHVETSLPVVKFM